MIKGIVAYTAEQVPNGIRIMRATAGQREVAYEPDWDRAACFLTEDKGEALHIVWNLQHFTNILFKLLPEPPKEGRTQIGATKLFYVEKMLGIGQKFYVRGNICEQHENNFYQLQHWMPGQDEPKDVQELSERGEKVLEALKLLNIYPNKLTSPVGVFSQSLPPMPTLLSGQEILVDVANYCSPMMRKEWRQTFSQGYYETLHSYDIVSAYPCFISQLLDTNHCKIEHVTECRPLKKNEWGIFKGEYKPVGDIQPIKQTDFLTSDEIRWIEYWQAGEFSLEDGYILTFLNDKRPYSETIQTLYDQRLTLQSNEIATFLAKNIAQGISGKLDQVNEDGNLGDFCNPIYAAMVRSKTRLRLGHYINNWIKNGQIKQSDIVNINLDEVTFRNPVDGFCQPENLRPGDWRYRVKEKIVVA
jgi:hypothetical protein